MNDEEDDFDRAAAAFSDHMRGLVASLPRGKTPELLYHYTNSAGLIGIVESSRLWATDCLYMNDRSEAEYASELVMTRVKKFAATKRFRRLDLIKLDLDFLWQTTDFNLYVTCFCERDNLLNQWRIYAGNQGYSIGLRTSDVKQYNGSVLCRVIYNRRKQIRMIDELLFGAATFIDALFEERDFDTETWDELSILFGNQMMWEISLASLAFKHPSFSVEHEWRLVTLGMRQTKALHRAGPYGLTPYILHGPKNIKERLAIASITHGPTPSPGNAKRAIRSLLYHNGHKSHEIDIKGSEVPIRVPLK